MFAVHNTKVKKKIELTIPDYLSSTKNCWQQNFYLKTNKILLMATLILGRGVLILCPIGFYQDCLKVRKKRNESTLCNFV